jgi:hypothetical protein
VLHNSEPPKKIRCFARRHMTPSQYVTYDAMRHMRGKAPNPPVCYAPIWKISNHSGLGRDTTIENIKSLLASGWLMPAPDSFERFDNTGQWVSKQYVLREDVHDHCPACPPFKYDDETGKNLAPSPIRNGATRVGTTRLRPSRNDPTPPESGGFPSTESERPDTRG